MILFSQNQITQSDASNPLLCIYNSTQKQLNGTIEFDNNSFSTQNGIGKIIQQGPANKIIFTNNKLTNVVINFSFNNNKEVIIKNNTISLTEKITIPPQATVPAKNQWSKTILISILVLLLGFAGGVLALFGDLSVSMLKRQVGAKDTGKLLPGHGGVFDRMDSILFVLPFVYQVVVRVIR